LSTFVTKPSLENEANGSPTCPPRGVKLVWKSENIRSSGRELASMDSAVKASGMLPGSELCAAQSWRRTAASRLCAARITATRLIRTSLPEELTTRRVFSSLHTLSASGAALGVSRQGGRLLPRT